jgi:hypothetical protein
MATSYSYSLAFYHTPAQIDAMTSPADAYPYLFTPTRRRMLSYCGGGLPSSEPATPRPTS